MGIELAIIGTVGALTAAAGGLSAYQQHQAGKAENAAAQAQARQFQIQAQNERAKAAVAQIQGEREAERRFLTLSQDIGSLYASMAGNGLDIGAGGTVANALNTTVSEANADVGTIQDTTRMNVWGHLANATQYQNEAGLAAFKGKTAKRSATLGAIGTGIGTLGSAIGAMSGTATALDNLGTAFSWNK